MRRARPRGQQPTRFLALGVSLAYAVLVGAGGSTLVVLTGRDSAPDDYGGWPGAVDSDTGYVAPTTAASSQSPWPSTTTTAGTTSAEPDFVWVSGGGGVVTVVPAAWQRQSRSETLDEASDPLDTSRLVRYGGAPAADARPLLERIVDAERDASARRPGYQRVRLEPVAFHETEAVAWEFEYYADTGDWLRCSARYWMADGIEYVLYAQSSHSDWSAMEPVLERMIESAGPVR